MKVPIHQVDAFTVIVSAPGDELVAKQLSARGGDLLCSLHGDRVVIAGRAVEYLRGEISIEC